jgi:hypothetical protein
MQTVFTYADAITRIQNLEEPLWPPGITSSQQLQAINLALDYLWTNGDFDGLIQDVTGITSTGGIITLPAQYRFLISLATKCHKVGIKSQQWKLSPSAPNITDWTKWTRSMLAFDLGDTGTASLGIWPGGVIEALTDGVPNGTYFSIVINDGIIGYVPASNVNPPSTSSARQYQVTGDPAHTDTLTFFGQAKLRYTYAADISSVVAPDCFPAILEAVRAYHFIACGDTTRAQAHFAEALKLLEANSFDVVADEDMGCVALDPMTSGGGFLNID